MLSNVRTLAHFLVMAMLLGTAQSASAKEQVRPDDLPRARHIILFIGDGMAHQHEVAASRYLHGGDARLGFHQFPYRNSATTWDVTTYDSTARLLGRGPYDPSHIIPTIGCNPFKGDPGPHPFQRDGIDGATLLNAENDRLTRPFATDSASAATAWATGHKTDDGNIAWLPGDPDNGGLTTIAELLRRRLGYAIGIVSTVPFNHATPAAHVSHNKDRENYHDLAREILTAVRPEVVIGGGHPLFDARCPDPNQPAACMPVFMPLALYHDMKSRDGDEYLFVERTSGRDGALALLQEAQEAAAKGRKLFGLFGGPDGNFESPVPQDLPGTPLVTRATIENPLLRDATLAALKVLSQDKEGFFLVVEQGDIDWANHANDYRRMIGTMWDLDSAVGAAVDFVDREGDHLDWGNTLLIVTADHGTGLMRLNGARPLGAGDLPAQAGRSYPDGEVSYGTSRHTNEPVRVYAKGMAAGLFFGHEGRWYPCRRIIDNTQLYHIMAEAAGVPQNSPLKIEKANP